MIFFRQDGDLVVTTQTDHAFFSGQLAGLWRDDELPDNPRREEILFGIREHDNGWRETDSAPWVNPESGDPYSFLDIPTEIRFEIWLRGVQRFADEHAYASLLIAHHASGLHEDHRQHEGWEAFFERLDELRKELTQRSGADAITVRRDYRILELTDLLSLAVCNDWREPIERGGLRFSVRPPEEERAPESSGLPLQEMAIEPLPLAGATTFGLRYRRIPDRPYRSDGDLAGALAEARWLERKIRVVSG
ncbi:MAG: DUF3891 family protein [Acidobacteriota bacterium]|nr:DUF3891 family protein [Acidobacteriota bacterium]